MIFITGGSYQGKLDFARERYGLAEGEIQRCDEDTAALDPDRRCIAGLEQFILNRLRSGIDPTGPIEALTDRRPDAILILDDIGGGVVPVDEEARAWREACGSSGALLADRADEVWRVFFGLAQRLK